MTAAHLLPCLPQFQHKGGQEKIKLKSVRFTTDFFDNCLKRMAEKKTRDDPGILITSVILTPSSTHNRKSALISQGILKVNIIFPTQGFQSPKS
jgi:hypothetical protein